MSHTEIYIYIYVCVYRKPKWITCIAPLWKIIALSMVRLSCVYHYVKLPLVHQPMTWSMMYVDIFIQMYTVEALWVGKTNKSPRKYMAHEVYGLEKQQWVIFTTDIFFLHRRGVVTHMRHHLLTSRQGFLAADLFQAATVNIHQVNSSTVGSVYKANPRLIHLVLVLYT